MDLRKASGAPSSFRQGDPEGFATGEQQNLNTLKHTTPQVGINGRFAADVAHYGTSWSELLAAQPDDSVDCSFVDPQYRDDLDALAYGNEGARQRMRCDLPQQSDDDIIAEFTEISRVTKVGGYVFLWAGHFTVCKGDLMRFCGAGNPHRMRLVDLIVWHNPSHMTGGSRSRTVGAFLVVFQKQKSGKTKHRANWLRTPCIKRVWTEGISRNQKEQTHVHAKPVGLQATIIKCVTPKGGLVLDANAGSFGVMQAAHSVERHFIGCELLTAAKIQEINSRKK